MELKDKLLELRKKNKLSQEKLAEKLNVSRQAISKWEQGINYPDIANLKVLCEIYHISMDELLDGNKVEAIKAFEKREKECPQCHSFIPVESVFCKNCGYLFKKKKKKYYFIIIIVIIVAIVIGLLVFNHFNEKQNQELPRVSDLIVEQKEDEGKEDNSDSSSSENIDSNTGNTGTSNTNIPSNQYTYSSDSNSSNNSVDYGDIYSGESKKYDIVNGYDAVFYSEFPSFNGNVSVQRWHIKQVNDSTVRFTIYYTADNIYKVLCFIPPDGNVFSTQGIDIKTKQGSNVFSIDVPLSVYTNYLTFSISFARTDCSGTACDTNSNRGFVYYNRAMY